MDKQNAPNEFYNPYSQLILTSDHAASLSCCVNVIGRKIIVHDNTIAPAIIIMIGFTISVLRYCERSE